MNIFIAGGSGAIGRQLVPMLVRAPFAATIRVREEGTRNLVAAARSSGARRFIAQSISFICAPVEGALTDEDTPLYLEAPPAIRPLAQSVSELEEPARLLGAPVPGHLSEDSAREKLGDMLVYVFNEQSGASNRKAKNALAWQPSISSWRTGFEQLYASA